MSDNGRLYLVATPIGNLEDITIRALKVLKEADIIAAEDTMRTVKLLNHYEIKKNIVSYHEHNKLQRGSYLINQLEDGKTVALVSDAGTPGISDPGEDLVRIALDNGIEVLTVPGPVAAVAGLVISGIPAGRFIFEGFLPMNKRLRKERIKLLKDELRTVIFYEAPHKLLYTLKDMLEILGDRKIAIARELTKKFEQLIRCTLAEAVEKYSAQSPKGEFVLILEGVDKKGNEGEDSFKQSGMSLQDHVGMYMEMGMDKKAAIKKAAEDRGLSKRDVYNSLLDNETENEHKRI